MSQSFMRALPSLPAVDTIEWLGWFNNAQQVLFDESNSGPTSDRPTKVMYTGKPYFDTTLGFKIWWNGTAWVNASGGAV